MIRSFRISDPDHIIYDCLTALAEIDGSNRSRYLEKLLLKDYSNCKNIDLKSRKKAKERLRRLEFRKHKRDVREMLNETYTPLNIQQQMIIMMYKGLPVDVIQNTLKKLMKAKKLIPKKLVNDNPEDWNKLHDLLKDVRKIETMQNAILEKKKKGITRKIISDLSFGFDDFKEEIELIRKGVKKNAKKK